MSHVDISVLVKALTHTTETKRFKQGEAKAFSCLCRDKIRERSHCDKTRANDRISWKKNCHLLFDINKMIARLNRK